MSDPPQAQVTVRGAEHPHASQHEASARRELRSVAGGIRERRGQRSQRKIAREAGVSQSFLSDLENGRKRLTLSTARKLAPVLGVTPGDLMLAERWTTLAQAAQAEQFDCQLVLDAVERLTEVLPGGKTGEVVAHALAKALQTKAEIFRMT